MKKIVLLQLLVVALLVSCTYAGKDPDQAVMKAYELRMDGKVDAAKVMLDSILLAHPQNAMAHYEKARVLSYMMNASKEVKIGDVLESVNLAIDNDPGNVSYVYFKAVMSFLDAYISMQMSQGEIPEKVKAACEEFENVLKLKPDYYDARLYLVDIYGLLPPEMGGDSAKAAEYADLLEDANTYYGAKARSILSPEDMDYVKFWEELMAKNNQDPRYMMEAGKACLYAEEPDRAAEYFAQAMELDPAYNILLLDMMRYYLYSVMGSQDQKETALPLAKKYGEKYLASQPDPIVPLKAYTIGWISRFEKFLGNEEASQQMTEKAKALDPYFSRATGLPSMLDFIPPDEVCYCYMTFFGPF